MTRDEAVSRIQRGLGFYTMRSTEIIDELKLAQEMLEDREELPKFLLSEISSISTTADEERVPFPSDFLAEYDGDALWYYNSSAEQDKDKWVKLKKDYLDELRTTASLAGSGAPQAYSRDGLYFRIFPTPDDAYPLKMMYFKTDTVLDTNVENKWLAKVPLLLIGIAGKAIASAMHDQGAVTAFADMEARGEARWLETIVNDEMEGLEPVIGGAD